MASRTASRSRPRDRCPHRGRGSRWPAGAVRRSSAVVPVPVVRPEVKSMPLTPADVHNVVFKKPPIGKRGYDEDEVDAFLDVVEAELARLIEENNELRSGSGRRPDVPVEAPEPA